MAPTAMAHTGTGMFAKASRLTTKARPMFSGTARLPSTIHDPEILPPGFRRFPSHSQHGEIFPEGLRYLSSRGRTRPP